MNLNNLEINTDDINIPLENNNIKQDNIHFDNIEVFFRDLSENLISKIKQFSDGLIFGSIAWLTCPQILNELSKCSNVQIIVQKEDFLRPDIGESNNTNWKSKLRESYDKLNFELERYDCQYPINHLSVCGDPTVDPIRCVGNHNKDKTPAFPRAHNKFIVFCEFVDEPSDDNRKNNKEIYKPVAVWTGSFNLTKNAANSFENCIYLEDRSGENPIIKSYLKEHHQIFALSESIDWTSTWVEPEFRIGT